MSNIPITVCGTVATAPQARTLPTGRPCASFRLAVNHWRVDKQTGEFVSDTTSWFGVDCYGSLASNVGSSVTLGMSVVIQGHLRIREWESQERSGIAPTIIADHLGPDLRFGTANYVKAQGTASGRQSAPAQEAEGSGSGWDALPRENTGAAGRTDSFERSAAGSTDGARTETSRYGTASSGYSNETSGYGAESSGYAAGGSADDAEAGDSVDATRAGRYPTWQSGAPAGGDDESADGDEAVADDSDDSAALDDDDSTPSERDDIAGATAAAAAPF